MGWPSVFTSVSYMWALGRQSAKESFTSRGGALQQTVLAQLFNFSNLNGASKTGHGITWTCFGHSLRNSRASLRHLELLAAFAHWPSSAVASTSQPFFSVV